MGWMFIFPVIGVLLLVLISSLSNKGATRLLADNQHIRVTLRPDMLIEVFYVEGRNTIVSTTDEAKCFHLAVERLLKAGIDIQPGSGEMDQLIDAFASGLTGRNGFKWQRFVVSYLS